MNHKWYRSAFTTSKHLHFDILDASWLHFILDITSELEKLKKKNSCDSHSVSNLVGNVVVLFILTSLNKIERWSNNKKRIVDPCILYTPNYVFVFKCQTEITGHELINTPICTRRYHHSEKEKTMLLHYI